MEWMLLPFKRYADFKGRSRRKEFWMFQLFYWIVVIALLAIMFAGLPWETFGDDYDGGQGSSPDFGFTFIVGATLLGLWYLGTFIPQLAVTVRRLHDRGLSGWWYAGLLIAGFVPLINLLVLPGYLILLVVLILPGEEKPNRWGEDPKDPHHAEVFA
ncbi:DUF805 domain-containing protein [Aurantiacibacter aquimixticola]|uniref:DUF805 domain-containing protein n=1 Tax=Aurantiacibacter aquimixticola TaxID=1958945 RepID=A0A419RT70_9SPHN|nr:DUF805 domain-containing protein [Aurantiacibacter aquimixticola]RJY08966.1 DUF805 domain-containing protein [Aurantiacibacter aquimixticola]